MMFFALAPKGSVHKAMDGNSLSGEMSYMDNNNKSQCIMDMTLDGVNCLGTLLVLDFI